MTQVIEYLPSKSKTLHSNPSTAPLERKESKALSSAFIDHSRSWEFYILAWMESRQSVFFFFFWNCKFYFLYCAGGTLAFTKVLTIYYTWIHPLHHSPLFPYFPQFVDIKNAKLVAHACNPSYSGDQEDRGWKPARANSSWDPTSKILNTKRASGVA
jgi:hypothetical protein